MGILRYIFLFLLLLISGNSDVIAANNSASAEMSFTIQEFVQIKPVTSPVLTANITDRTGNMQAPLLAEFSVISNSPENKTLYLKSTALTEGGYEDSMFHRNGMAYIAFANITKIPTSRALNNCKNSSISINSPGVVAYPVVSVKGAQSKFNSSKNKFEISAPQGKSQVKVLIGQNVLRSSFASNDPKGFYQAVLSLTEADI